MDPKDVRKRLEENPELAKSLEEAFRRNAGTEELSGILADIGIDSEVADDLLAEIQRIRGTKIGAEHVDPETLKMVAGGTDVKYHGGCSEDFYREQCTSVVDIDVWCDSNDFCWAYDSTYNCTVLSLRYDLES